ncbi:HAD family hydrolase [Halothece sp. PCC 7418]|uniref:HAD family hydrolase n=1 Tax=Halothece sp. (strain PCC 7418) TaxID=65093 RepID=UPI0002E504F9|nr:HAD family hydrolase [Halothece sp. PCC 7418]
MSKLKGPGVLALDFDGVLCDGRAEYLESSWRVYTEIWEGSEVDLETLRPRFYQLRSVIETGWEMPLLLRSLQEGMTDASILENWSAVVTETLEQNGLTQQEMARLLDEKRDHWIETNPQDWLAHHQFYPGVIPRLQAILKEATTQVYIITTKEGRFARTLLAEQGIRFPSDHIMGKESQQPKRKTLTSLSQKHDQPWLWFVEDRLKTLLSVADSPELDAVRLFLAAWGYNTARSRQQAQDHQQIQLLSLQQFHQDFSHWC